MNDAVRVRLFQRLGDLYRQPNGFARRQRALNGFPLDVFHHQIVRTDVVKLADVRMVKRSDGAGFVAESFRVLALESFDGYGAVDTSVEGLPHLAHTTRADVGEQLIGAQPGADAPGNHRAEL